MDSAGCVCADHIHLLFIVGVIALAKVLTVRAVVGLLAKPAVVGVLAVVGSMCSSWSTCIVVSVFTEAVEDGGVGAVAVDV